MAPLKNRTLLMLFLLAVFSKALVKSTLGKIASFSLMIGVGIYYLHARRARTSVYEEIALQQAQAAAKLDALEGKGNGQVTEMDLAIRKTQFTLNQADMGIVTDRMHKYSKKLSGNRAERQKFIRKRKKKEDPGENNPEGQPQDITMTSNDSIAPSVSLRNRRNKKNPQTTKTLDHVVEEME